MERRSVLKFVALTALTQKLSALPGSVMEQMPSMQSGPPAAPYTLRFFSPEESLFLDQVMELIIPADDHSPGAHEAQTNLFADLMVSIASDAVKKQWREGIHAMRQEARRNSLPAALEKASLQEEHPKTGQDRFFVVLKQMTIDGYYTSTVGIHKDLQYVGNAYLGAYPGCSHEEHQDS